ncbi:MAG: outer membrane protein [Phenylobacterium sp.]|jgi:outer membrane protein
MNKKLLPFIISFALGSVSTLANADDLNQIYQLALTKDPQVLKAAATMDSNKEGIVQAKSALFPQLSFSGGVTYTDSSGSRQNANLAYVPLTSDSISNRYRFRLSQEIFNMSTWHQLAISQKRALQSELSYKMANQNLINRVAQVYFNILKAQDDLQLAQAENKAIERQLEQTNQRFKVGLTAITDVHEAQAQFDTSVASVIRSENNVEIQKELLREITGRYHDDLAPLNTARFSTSKQDNSASGWVSLANNNNSELQIETINMQIAQENIKDADAGHLPTISLDADWGRNNTNRDRSSSDGVQVPTQNPQNSESKSVGISLSVPIFSGFRTESGIKQAQIDYVAASEDRELAHRRIVRVVRTSYAEVATLISTLKALEQAQVSANSALKATEAGFEVGTRTIVDVLNSTQSLFNAKRNLASSRYDYIMAVLNLKQSAGMVSEADINGINKGLGK